MIHQYNPPGGGPLLVLASVSHVSMTKETRNIPDWAVQERQIDLDWIRDNLDLLQSAAATAFENIGRGAMVVDTTGSAMTGRGHPIAFFPEELVDEHGNDDTRRIVSQYEPSQEMVLVLLKPLNRTSTYRLRVMSPGAQTVVDGEAAKGQCMEPAAEARLEPPDIETLMEWEAEGGCEAACPYGCWVEPDGTCPHGNPSWLLRLGLI